MPFVVKYPSGSYLCGGGWYSGRTANLDEARLFNRRGPASSAITVARRRHKFSEDQVPRVVEVTVKEV